MPQINKITSTSVVDRRSGELIDDSVEIQSYQVEKEPTYVKLYTQDIGRLYGLTNSANNLLMTLAKYMTYGSNVIVLYGPVKDAICNELGMNKNTLNKAIDDLYKQGFLIRKARACYILDPEIFGTGNWKNVQKIRLSIEYNADGTKTIKTEVKRNDGKCDELHHGLTEQPTENALEIQDASYEDCSDKREEEPSSQYEDTVLEQAIKQKNQEDSEHVG